MQYSPRNKNENNGIFDFKENHFVHKIITGILVISTLNESVGYRNGCFPFTSR